MVISDVLAQAGRFRAFEVVLETGQPVVFMTPEGVQSLPDLLDRDALFEALQRVLGPEQQVELAVGNVVEFGIEATDGRWTFVTEPSLDGLSVRGRLDAARPVHAPAAVRGTVLDLPPLEPFMPPPGDDLPAGSMRRMGLVGDGGLSDLDVDLDEADLPPRIDRERHFSDETKTTARDLQALDVPLVEEPEVPPPRRPWFAPPGSRGPSPQDAMPTPSGLGPVSSPSLGARDGSFPSSAPRPLTGRATVRVPAADEGQLKRPPSVLLPEPHPPLGSQDGELFALLDALPHGSLCFLYGTDVLSHVIDRLGSQFAVVDHDGIAAAGGRLPFAPPGYLVAVDREDPSVVLGWLLRRLEEGARVVVATRAIDIGGARRVLLGTSATRRAEKWLESHPATWLGYRDGRWITLQA